MNHGAITASIDIAQVVLYLFWGFFAALVIYLHREGQREGYPLETADRSPNKLQEGLGGRPQPKTYLLPHGGTKTVPEQWKAGPAEQLKARRADRNPDSPLVPTGNPLLAGVGPGAWADRDDHPDLEINGNVKIVPLRTDAEYGVAKGDPDPRGKTVFGADGKSGGSTLRHQTGLGMARLGQRDGAAALAVFEQLLTKPQDAKQTALAHYGRAMAHALLKLYQDNASTLTPDPLYVKFYYSHPPASERLAKMVA